MNDDGEVRRFVYEATDFPNLPWAVLRFRTGPGHDRRQAGGPGCRRHTRLTRASHRSKP